MGCVYGVCVGEAVEPYNAQRTAESSVAALDLRRWTTPEVSGALGGSCEGQDGRLAVGPYRLPFSKVSDIEGKQGGESGQKLDVQTCCILNGP